jgi:hypothetical protein
MIVQGVPAVEQEVKSLHPTHWCWEFTRGRAPGAGTRAVIAYTT